MGCTSPIHLPTLLLNALYCTSLILLLCLGLYTLPNATLTLGDTARLFILLTFAVLLLIGVPVWWMTTNVYRATIPDITIDKSHAIKEIPIRLSLHIIHPKQTTLNQGELNSLRAAVRQSANATAEKFRKTYPIGICKFFVTSSETDLPNLSPGELDNWISEQVSSASLLSHRNGHYSLVVIVDPSATQPSATIGSRRHAWIVVSKFEDAKPLVPVLSAQLRHMLFSPITTEAPRKRSYRFVFSLLNEDPESTVVSWNFPSLESQYLKELISTFGRVHNIAVESQVVHYTQLKHAPFFDKSTKEHYFTPASLPRFVDGTEWKVDSGANAKELSLHFATFVPSAAHTPLVVRNGPSSVSKGFIAPHWGGVVIANLPVGEERPKNYVVDGDAFLPVLQVFVSQLRQLIGLPVFTTTIPSPAKAIPHINILPATRRGASDFEVDALARRNIWGMLSETQHTLTQFKLMVDQIRNIPIHDHIHKSLTGALTHRSNALVFLHDDFDHDAAHTALAAALIAAEDVFFDKDMLGMLYFPSGHQLAIYLPLFLPLSFPIVAGLRAELARRRKKQAKSRSS